MFSWLPPQQCVSYPCVCLIRPWMLMEATDCPLGFGLAWPYRPQCKSMLSVSLTNLSVSLLLYLSLPSLWLSRLSSSHCLSFSHFYISVSKTLKHFRIFWSSSVLGWWHGTSVASLSDLCPQRACSKWLRPLLQNDSHTNTLIKRAKKICKEHSHKQSAISPD